MCMPLRIPIVVHAAYCAAFASAQETAQQCGRALQVLGESCLGPDRVTGDCRLDDGLVLPGGVVVQLALSRCSR
jgi:hypothetical protein